MEELKVAMNTLSLSGNISPKKQQPEEAVVEQVVAAVVEPPAAEPSEPPAEVIAPEPVAEPAA